MGHQARKYPGCPLVRTVRHNESRLLVKERRPQQKEARHRNRAAVTGRAVRPVPAVEEDPPHAADPTEALDPGVQSPVVEDVRSVAPAHPAGVVKMTREARKAKTEEKDAADRVNGAGRMRGASLKRVTDRQKEADRKAGIRRVVAVARDRVVPQVGREAVLAKVKANAEANAEIKERYPLRVAPKVSNRSRMLRCPVRGLLRSPRAPRLRRASRRQWVDRPKEIRHRVLQMLDRLPRQPAVRPSCQRPIGS